MNQNTPSSNPTSCSIPKPGWRTGKNDINSATGAPQYSREYFMQLAATQINQENLPSAISNPSNDKSAHHAREMVWSNSPVDPLFWSGPSNDEQKIIQTGQIHPVAAPRKTDFFYQTSSFGYRNEPTGDSNDRSRRNNNSSTNSTYNGYNKANSARTSFYQKPLSRNNSGAAFNDSQSFGQPSQALNTKYSGPYQNNERFSLIRAGNNMADTAEALGSRGKPSLIDDKSNFISPAVTFNTASSSGNARDTVLSNRTHGLQLRQQISHEDNSTLENKGIIVNQRDRNGGGVSENGFNSKFKRQNSDLTSTSNLNFRTPSSMRIPDCEVLMTSPVLRTSFKWNIVFWYYRDNSGNEQGPFEPRSMQSWYERDYFGPDLPVRAVFGSPRPPGVILNGISSNSLETIDTIEYTSLKDVIAAFCENDWTTPFLSASYSHIELVEQNQIQGSDASNSSFNVNRMPRQNLNQQELHESLQADQKKSSFFSNRTQHVTKPLHNEQKSNSYFTINQPMNGHVESITNVKDSLSSGGAQQMTAMFDPAIISSSRYGNHLEETKRQSYLAESTNQSTIRNNNGDVNSSTGYPASFVGSNPVGSHNNQNQDGRESWESYKTNQQKFSQVTGELIKEDSLPLSFSGAVPPYSKTTSNVNNNKIMHKFHEDSEEASVNQSGSIPFGDFQNRSGVGNWSMRTGMQGALDKDVVLSSAKNITNKSSIATVVPSSTWCAANNGLNSTLNNWTSRNSTKENIKSPSSIERKNESWSTQIVDLQQVPESTNEYSKNCKKNSDGTTDSAFDVNHSVKSSRSDVISSTAGKKEYSSNSTATVGNGVAFSTESMISALESVSGGNKSTAKGTDRQSNTNKRQVSNFDSDKANNGSCQKPQIISTKTTQSSLLVKPTLSKILQVASANKPAATAQISGADAKKGLQCSSVGMNSAGAKIAALTSKKTAQSTAPAIAGSTGQISKKIGAEFSSWFKQSLHKVEHGGVALEELMQIMCEFPVDDANQSETISTLASMVLDMSTQIDSRKFGVEFVRRRRQDLGLIATHKNQPILTSSAIKASGSAKVIAHSRSSATLTSSTKLQPSISIPGAKMLTATVSATKRPAEKSSNNRGLTSSDQNRTAQKSLRKSTATPAKTSSSSGKVPSSSVPVIAQDDSTFQIVVSKKKKSSAAHAKRRANLEDSV